MVWIFDESQLELTAGLNHLLGASGIAFARKLHEDFIVVAAVRLNRRLGKAKSIDAALDGFERLGHGAFLNMSNGTIAQGQEQSIGSDRRSAEIPIALELLVKQIAKLRNLIGRDTADDDVGVVHAAHFFVANILGAELSGDAIDRLIGLLGNGFLHLDLQNHVGAALKVQTKLDLVREKLFFS